jgi:hypothetical protein
LASALARGDILMVESAGDLSEGGFLSVVAADAIDDFGRE